eukprot:365605-Chlamydomonas_euryale.AAC.12
MSSSRESARLRGRRGCLLGRVSVQASEHPYWERCMRACVRLFCVCVRVRECLRACVCACVCEDYGGWTIHDFADI